MGLNLRYSVAVLTSIVIVALAVGYFLIFSQSRSGANLLRPNESAQMNRKDEEAKIVAAVVCYQLKQEDMKGRVIFLSTEDNRDPSDTFLKQVRCGAYDIRKVSQSTMDSGTVKDKSTGEKGIILGVTSIKWVKETETMVTGRMQSDRENLLTYVFRLVKEENNGWVVKERELTGEA
jgi:hypothetical protein